MEEIPWTQRKCSLHELLKTFCNDRLLPTNLTLMSLTFYTELFYIYDTQYCPHLITSFSPKINPYRYKSHPQMLICMWTTMCFLILLFTLNLRPQMWHACGFSPVCINMCCSQFCFVVNVLPHIGHGNIDGRGDVLFMVRLDGKVSEVETDFKFISS